MNQDIRELIVSRLKPEQMVFLATSMNDQPYIRPVTLIYNKDRFYIATGSADAKTTQIAANPKVEICILFREENYSGYIRARGCMEAVQDTSLRKEIFDSEEYIRHYWNHPDDEGFILYEMYWRVADYMHPGDDFSTTIDW